VGGRAGTGARWARAREFHRRRLVAAIRGLCSSVTEVSFHASRPAGRAAATESERSRHEIGRRGTRPWEEDDVPNGGLPHAEYARALQVSRAHVYLTYPFVLSWSLVEAMSLGCVVIGSSTPPVREVIDGANGILVDFFDVNGLAERVIEALAAPVRFQDLRQRARTTVLERYDLNRICLPALLQQMGIGPSPVAANAAPAAGRG
jgi:glycosyltransferase involved in cell wall biosynthesis